LLNIIGMAVDDELQLIVRFNVIACHSIINDHDKLLNHF